MNINLNKRIAIQTWGSTGDINPFIALAAGLSKAGFEVTLAITSTERTDYSIIGKRLGFSVVQVGYIGHDVESLNVFGKALFAQTNPLKQLRMLFDDLFSPNAEAMYQAAQKLCADHDLIIGHFISHPTHLAAEQAGKPYITVSLHHGMIFSRFSSPHPLPNLGRWLNPWLWHLVDSVINKVVLPPVNSLRKRHVAQTINSIRPVWESSLLNLIAVSSHLCQSQAGWTQNQQLCGFFNLADRTDPADQRQSAPIPPALYDFLQQGSPPVYITFGSMMGLCEASDDLDSMIQLWLQAVSLAGCRAIIQTHWSVAGPVSIDNNIYPVEEAVHTAIFPFCAAVVRIDNNIYPVEEAVHTAIFPFCAAVVHHGGAGTTQTATLCGCPSIVVAHIADQFFWGDLLHKLGLAPAVIKQRQLTAQSVAKAIKQEVLHSARMKKRAEEAGDQLSREEGVAWAVRLISTVKTQ